MSSSEGDVKNLLNLLQASSGVAEFHFVEGLGRVEPVTVACSHLIGVGVLFSSPTGSIPVLSIHSVTTSKRVDLGLEEMGVCTKT